LKTLVLSDAHVPFQSRKWDREVKKFIRLEQPAKIVLNGDMADFHALSQHRRNPKWEDNFEREIKGLWKWLEDLRQIAPKSDIRYVEGNHEARWNTYVQGRAPVLRMIGMDWDRYCGLPELGIKKTKAGFKVPCGQGQRVALFHGHEGRLGLSKFAGGTAYKFVHEHGCNVHIGHTHKMGMQVTRVGGRAFFGAEGGYGGDIRKPAFDFINARKPPWTLGFSYYDSEQTLSPYPNFVRV
jgi:predicted phosphodiesterase